MSRTAVPVALRDRLGHEASLALVELLDSEKDDWSEHMVSLAGERYERRLTEVASGLWLEFHDGLLALRQELATTRVEMFKWSFVFWIGQVAAMAGLLAFMLQGR